MNLPPSFYLYWGAPGSIKSSMAATFPGPIEWFGFDIGGFKRARVPEGQEITVYEYPAPIKLEMEKKRVDLEGWSELWAEFLKDYTKALKGPAQTLVIDTGTRCWIACHRAYLQMKQENARAQGKHPAESLLQIEYGEVNPWMFSVLDSPDQQGKNLVVTAHDEEERIDQIVKGEKESVIVTDSYGKPVMKPQGFRHITKNAAIAIQMYIEDGVGWGEVTKSGLVTSSLTGAKIRLPTYQKLVEVLEGAEDLEKIGLPVPAVWP